MIKVEDILNRIYTVGASVDAVLISAISLVSSISAINVILVLTFYYIGFYSLPYVVERFGLKF